MRKMAKRKDDKKYATAQARLSEDEAVRVSYKHGTPLGGGKIVDSEPVDFFCSAHNISKSNTHQPLDSANTSDQSQLHHNPDIDNGGGGKSNTER
ncbi:hypothetical protein FNV43_RR19697 [Rhamnella rubrinervis]|uniref:Uncharacterized protein n=1 Tax=Rhamnella rubrinervis TaxID=2594499 RepID=A0A8K0GSN6_9ROSA|nr:hypothetical protein FNV43_RR19697 [Rhamnella rubrinervis]